MKTIITLLLAFIVLVCQAQISIPVKGKKSQDIIIHASGIPQTNFSLSENGMIAKCFDYYVDCDYYIDSTYAKTTAHLYTWCKFYKGKWYSPWPYIFDIDKKAGIIKVYNRAGFCYSWKLI